MNDLALRRGNVLGLHRTVSTLFRKLDPRTWAGLPPFGRGCSVFSYRRPILFQTKTSEDGQFILRLPPQGGTANIDLEKVRLRGAQIRSTPWEERSLSRVQACLLGPDAHVRRSQPSGILVSNRPSSYRSWRIGTSIVF